MESKITLNNSLPFTNRTFHKEEKCTQYTYIEYLLRANKPHEAGITIPASPDGEYELSTA